MISKTNIDIIHYEYAQNLLLELSKYFLNECCLSCHVSYFQSYFTYFKYSDFSEVWLEYYTDKENHKGVWLHLGMMMIRDDVNQYHLHIGGSYNIDYYLDNVDLDILLDILKKEHVMPEGYIPDTIAEMFQF